MAPEYDGAAEFTAQAVASASSWRSVTPPPPAQAQACLDAGAKVFVHTYNGMSGLHHREPGMVGAALSSQDKSYSELICDGHHVNPISAGIVMNAKGHEHVAWLSPTACAPAVCRKAITSWASFPSGRRGHRAPEGRRLARGFHPQHEGWLR